MCSHFKDSAGGKDLAVVHHKVLPLVLPLVLVPVFMLVLPSVLMLCYRYHYR
jgi:hypothetical protein